MRRFLVAATALVGLLLGAAAAAAPAPSMKHFSGIVPDVPTGGDVPPIARIANLPYGGGPVMHSNRTHVIFWQPRDSTLTYDPGYQLQVELFLRRVAADSHKPTNVYSLSGQYRDSGGPAAYDSTYAGPLQVSDPLPANGCAEPPGSGPGWQVCLNDSQLENEIRRTISVNRLPIGSHDIYFLVMPNGMGTCETTGPDNCALGGQGADGSFCGYHSSTRTGGSCTR